MEFDPDVLLLASPCRDRPEDSAGIVDWNGRGGPSSRVDSPVASVGIGVYGGGSSVLVIDMAALNHVTVFQLTSHPNL